MMSPRYLPLAIVALATRPSLGLGAIVDAAWFLAADRLRPALARGYLGSVATEHTIMRLYPISAHFRWLFEWLRPYMREYLLDGDHQGRPFNHNERALIYRRAKDIGGVQAFGTDRDLYSPRYEWINHSIQAVPHESFDYRITIGSERCEKTYDASVLNISAMSFGSLGGRALKALNLGAKLGGFYHDTGEGGISDHHLSHGGDLVWEIGSGYFGCRTADGRFEKNQYAELASLNQVKMIEIKLSQGAKPGHGGMLPDPKVTPEIARARRVTPWQEVVYRQAIPHLTVRPRRWSGWQNSGNFRAENRSGSNCA